MSPCLEHDGCGGSDEPEVYAVLRRIQQLVQL